MAPDLTSLPQGRWRIAHHTVEQQHYFNCPLQIGSNTEDKPEDADKYEFAVQPGDVVVTATDGAYDNVFDDDIVDVLNAVCDPSSMRAAARLGQLAELLRDVADELAEMACKAAKDAVSDTPFSVAAQRSGIAHRGGKCDDVTVLVSAVVAAGEEGEAA